MSVEVAPIDQESKERRKIFNQLKPGMLIRCQPDMPDNFDIKYYIVSALISSEEAEVLELDEETRMNILEEGQIETDILRFERMNCLAIAAGKSS